MRKFTVITDPSLFLKPAAYKLVYILNKNYFGFMPPPPRR